MSSLLPIFRWFDETWIGDAINESNWLFPAIEGVHIVALALLLGAIVVLDLRLFGVMLRTKPTAQLYRELAPWILCSLVVILATGLMLFASEALKAYSSGPFQVKIVLLFAAILSHYTIHRKVANADEGHFSPLWAKAAATVSLVLWFGVGYAGRAIGFL